MVGVPTLLAPREGHVFDYLRAVVKLFSIPSRRSVSDHRFVRLVRRGSRVAHFAKFTSHFYLDCLIQTFNKVLNKINEYVFYFNIYYTFFIK